MKHTEHSRGGGRRRRTKSGPGPKQIPFFVRRTLVTCFLSISLVIGIALCVLSFRILSDSVDIIETETAAANARNGQHHPPTDDKSQQKRRSILVARHQEREGGNTAAATTTKIVGWSNKTHHRLERIRQRASASSVRGRQNRMIPRQSGPSRGSIDRLVASNGTIIGDVQWLLDFR